MDKGENAEDNNIARRIRKTLGWIPHINTTYLAPKAFYFFYFAGAGALMPFLPLFYKQLGLPANQVGIISGVQPFVSFVLLPLWGMLADRFKKGRLIFMISYIAVIGSAVAYKLTPTDVCVQSVPSDRTNVTLEYPSHLDNLKSTIMKHLPKDKTDARSKLDSSALAVNERPRQYNNFSIFKRLSDIIEKTEKVMPWPLEDATGKENDKDAGNTYRHQKFNSFVYLLLVSLLGTLISCPSLALGDAAILCLLRKNNETHKYGKQKMWASVGWGVSAFVFGASVSNRYLCPLTGGTKYIDYGLCFYGFIALKCLALLTGLQLDFDMEVQNEASETQIQDESRQGVMTALKTITQPRYLAFFAVVVYSGMMFGFLMGFLFWRLKDLGGAQLLFSIIPAVRCFCDSLIYAISPHLLSTIGHLNLIYLALVCYVIRLLSYAFLSNPWAVLPLEVLSGITSAGAWAGMVTYIACNSIDGAAATLQGSLHGMYHGIGHGLGRVLGGCLLSAVGAKATFSSFAALGAVVLIVYFLVNKGTDKY